MSCVILSCEKIQTFFIFRAICDNTAHVKWIRCSPKGSHLIRWTSAAFSHIALKWTLFAYHCGYHRIKGALYYTIVAAWVVCGFLVHIMYWIWVNNCDKKIFLIKLILKSTIHWLLSMCRIRLNIYYVNFLLLTGSYYLCTHVYKP